MRCALIRCYFTNSEDFIKEIIGERNIECKKVPNTREDLGLFTMYTDWFLTSDENVVNDLITSIENEDYDIEIITDVLEMFKIVWHS